jgi:uncharacterized protein involved in exopolysaccharide biosynthesis
MTSPGHPSDLDAEREVDLVRWRGALVRLWWLPVAGLVVGAIVGILYSFSGGTNFKATALISLGQPVSPGGVAAQGYGQNPRAVSQIVSAASVQRQVEDRADMRPGALRGQVSVAQVGSATGAGAARATPLISLTVAGKRSETVAAAANALAGIVVSETTAKYVGTKIATYTQVLKTTDSQLASINLRLAELNRVLKVSHLDPLNELVLVSQIDNSEQRQGNLFDQQATTQQQLAFARTVESATIVTRAAAVKASAHSRGSSALIGALIGLILGAIAAIAVDGRRAVRA